MTYPYPMPKSRTIIRLHSHLSAGLAPHGISCHYKSDKQLFYNALIRCNFAPSEYDRGKDALRRTTARRERRAAIRRQADSLFKRTEQVVFSSDKKSFVRRKPTCPTKAGENPLQSRGFRKRKNTNQKSHVYGENNEDQNRQKTQEQSGGS